MIEKSSMYVNGNLAEKLQYNVYEENAVLKEKRKAKSNIKVKVKIVGLVLFLFVACFLLVYRYAAIANLNYKVIEAEGIYSNARNENDTLLSEIKKEMNLDNIQQIAETKLGMQKPDQYQRVYLNIPKTDYTIIEDMKASKPQKKRGFIASIKEKISGLVSFLY